MSALFHVDRVVDRVERVLERGVGLRRSLRPTPDYVVEAEPDAGANLVGADVDDLVSGSREQLVAIVVDELGRPVVRPRPPVRLAKPAG